jgi:hypothetical protein
VGKAVLQVADALFQVQDVALRLLAVGANPMHDMNGILMVAAQV